MLFPCAESVEVNTVETPHDLDDWQSEGVVLVVDDEEKVRSLAARMLERVGFAILSAHDGVQALDLFEAHNDEIRFVLLDFTMPRMNGEDAFHRMRAIRNDVPVLFSSGYTEEDVLDRLQSETGISFVQKLYTVRDLNRAVRKIVVELDAV